MSELMEEVRLWNTPIVGAFLLYKFTQGYMSSHPNGEAPMAIQHFIAIAILTNERLKAPISNLRENLQSYVKSFEDNRSSDILLSIQERIKDKLPYTWSSIDIAVANGLLYWDVDEAKLYARLSERSPGYGNAPKAQVKKDGEKAEILGRWFSQHTINAITAYFKIIL
ncbi:hypothetical protein HH214_10440 [Mucilaginibacter robiniae]|uniref:Uncharacterized protein n=1 Tax=Mucilaginibacter robiniae TaxID=2728022 RepID=A0A7L5DZQ1_9SPHI|nr:three component ABC system middle component [Mucilaginibacter robiniae]QJD96251.1 hypothetical protein HH214_10440 [Mucilaginibacter robiniae]